MQNFTEQRKQPPVVILEQANFYDMFILCLWLRIIIRSDQGVQFMNFPSQIFFLNSVLYGCGFLLLLRKDAQNECALLKYCYSLSAAELNNIESGKEVFVQEFSCKESDYGDSNDEDIEQLFTWQVK